MYHCVLLIGGWLHGTEWTTTAQVGEVVEVPVAIRHDHKIPIRHQYYKRVTHNIMVKCGPTGIVPDVIRTMYLREVREAA